MIFNCVTVPIPSLNVTRDPDTTVNLRHGDNVTLTCTIQLDPAVDSDIIVTGELSGPGGTANGVVLISTGIYQIVLSILSLQATMSDTYTCSTTISPRSDVMNIIGLFYGDTYELFVGKLDTSIVV